MIIFQDTIMEACFFVNTGLGKVIEGVLSVAE